jgi:predicted transcriptional regulator
MSPRKPTKPEKPLTAAELEIMNAVWTLAESSSSESATIRDVHSALTEKQVAYTTVATLMKILEQKRFLDSHKNSGDKAHTYTPTVSRSEYESSSLKHLATHVFRGDPTSMVSRLLSDADLSTDELQAIRKILNERMASK